MTVLSEEFQTSEALDDEERAEVMAGAPIDVENPGFSSLHAVLLGILDDTVDDGVLVEYVEALDDRLVESHGRFKALIDELPADLPQEQREEAAAAAQAAAVQLDRLQEMMRILHAYLDNEQEADLELIEQALDILDEVRDFAGRL